MPDQTRTDDLRVLLVEDDPADAELVILALERAGFIPRWERVETEIEYLDCLAKPFDVILSDSNLPRFDGLRALDLLRARNLHLPFLLVSGRMGEDIAVDAMKRGADDYVLKDRLARLGEAVRRALERWRLRAEKMQAIEALRKSEEYYRLVSEVTADYGYALRVSANDLLACEWTTEAFDRITGFTVPEINARGWRSLFHPEDQAIAEQHYQMLLGSRPDVVELRTVTKKGDVRWVRLYERPVRTGVCMETLRIHGAAQDITTSRNLENQLHQSQKMEAIGRLAGGVAHDFNNLLTVISGYGGLLKNDPNANTTYIDPILHAAERASQLTRQLLVFSRRKTVKLRPVDINTVVSDIEKMLGRVIGENIELRTSLETEIGMVQADPGQLEQVIMNLAVNAQDAMPGGGRLTIETKVVEIGETGAVLHAGVAPGAWAVLSVRDTGTGMDRETQARIFEPFFTTKAPGKGTGLGLATVYGIVQQSGGNIGVDSEVGRGTEFRIYLPKLGQKEPAGAETPRTLVARS